MDRKNFRDAGQLPHHHLHGSRSLKDGDMPNQDYHLKRTVVDYPSFELDYWPAFDHTTTKGLPVALVFADIMGVIKGSAASRKSLTPLCREDYVARSHRLAPAFLSDVERLRVYDIFEAYEALKLDRGEVDDVDRVVKILKAIRRDLSLERLLKSTFDEVYIDGQHRFSPRHAPLLTN